MIDVKIKWDNTVWFLVQRKHSIQGSYYYEQVKMITWTPNNLIFHHLVLTHGPLQLSFIKWKSTMERVNIPVTNTTVWSPDPIFQAAGGI